MALKWRIPAIASKVTSLFPPWPGEAGGRARRGLIRSGTSSRGSQGEALQAPCKVLEEDLLDPGDCMKMWLGIKWTVEIGGGLICVWSGTKTLARVLCRPPMGLDRHSQLRFVAWGKISAHDIIKEPHIVKSLKIWLITLFYRLLCHLEKFLEEWLVVNPLFISVTRTVTPVA